MRIALIANPTSGRGRHGGAAHVAITALITAGHDVVVAHGSSYSESRANATALLERDGGLDALVVVGGDGTVHLGLDVVATTGVPLGIVAVGTGNDIARHLRAAGGYWADNRDGYTFLGEQVQMRLAADLAAGQHHYPDRAAQLADLADKSGISAATIETLLTAQVPSDEPEFTAYMTAIARLRSTM